MRPLLGLVAWLGQLSCGTPLDEEEVPLLRDKLLASGSSGDLNPITVVSPEDCRSVRGCTIELHMTRGTLRAGGAPHCAPACSVLACTPRLSLVPAAGLLCAAALQLASPCKPCARTGT